MFKNKLELLQTAGETLLAGGTIVADQEVRLEGGRLGGAGTLTGDLENAGGLVQPDDTATISIDGNFTQEDGQTLLPAQTTLGVTGSMNVSGGALGGIGTVEAPKLTVDGGQIQPGLSPGVLTVTGAYVPKSEGTLQIELAGTIPGEEFDRIEITADAKLDGLLAVQLIEGFEPRPSDEFQILTTAERTNEFATVTVEDEEARSCTFDVLYGSTDVVLTGIRGSPKVPATRPMTDLLTLVVILLLFNGLCPRPEPSPTPRKR